MRGFFVSLQQVMRHSDMKVSLTYLRGLEVKQLDVEDLSVLKNFIKLVVNVKKQEL